MILSLTGARGKKLCGQQCLKTLCTQFAWYVLKEDTVPNQLHMGHSKLAHSFILKKKEERVSCLCCVHNTVITIKHILMECADLVELERHNLYSLLQNESRENFDFLIEIGIFCKVGECRSKFCMEKYFNCATEILWFCIFLIYIFMWNDLTLLWRYCG